MALIDDVKSVCDRLAPLGWRQMLKDVTGGKLDIQQATPAALKAALTANLPTINREIPGFTDFDKNGSRGITAGRPSQSLLYHALASPRIVRDANSELLQGYPTIPEIEAVENFVFGIKPPTLAEIKQSAGGAKLAVVVYATEYRPCPDTADAVHADLTFSRTGIARVGTARAKYLPDIRGYWVEDEDNQHAFRIIPVRFTAWLAAPVKGKDARVMPMMTPDGKDDQRTFWIPVHKLFDGKECIEGLDLMLNCSAKFYNMKLARVMLSLDKNKKPPTGFPFVIEDGLGELKEHSEFGRIAVVPVVQEALVQRAIVDGKPLTFRVPKNGETGGFATYAPKTPSRPGLEAELHPFPAYVHARTKVKDGLFINLNDQEDGVDVETAVQKGGYDALLHYDLTGEGWVDVQVPAVAGKPGVQAGSRSAYVLLSAPDFFPSCGQRELGRWAKSPQVPAKFRDQIWGAPPDPLSDTRWPANLQLPGNTFDEKEDTITAVVGIGPRTGTPSTEQQRDAKRASTLPDDGAGVFAPGWDVAVDVKGPVKTGVLHLAAYGLGSPFPEDVKLCAALSTFWPAVAPDIYRTMSMHSGNFRGTVAPLTDDEIGQTGTLPWDGVPGPQIVRDGEKTFVELPTFLNVDYVVNSIENQFSNRLTARISAEEYERRILAAARIHWVLSGGTDVAETRARWLMISFRSVTTGDAELVAAENQAGHILEGPVYRAESCFVGDEDPSIESPKGPRFRRVPLTRHTSFFVSAEDPMALRRRDTNPQWGRVKAE